MLRIFIHSSVDSYNITLNTTWYLLQISSLTPYIHLNSMEYPV